MPETPTEQNQRAAQEWEIRQQRREQTCQKKTAEGNSFKYQCTAESRAAKDTDRSGLQVQAYKCVVCVNWHIGKQSWKS